VEGDPSKTARAHCHIQAWARHRGLVEKYQESHCLPSCPWHISRMTKVSLLQGGGSSPNMAVLIVNPNINQLLNEHDSVTLVVKTLTKITREHR
jgi:hypothetical protein